MQVPTNTTVECTNQVCVAKQEHGLPWYGPMIIIAIFLVIMIVAVKKLSE